MESLRRQGSALPVIWGRLPGASGHPQSAITARVQAADAGRGRVRASNRWFPLEVAQAASSLPGLVGRASGCQLKLSANLNPFSQRCPIRMASSINCPALPTARE